MTIKNVILQITNSIASRPAGFREGQTAFNALDEVRPDLSEKIRGDLKLDPYYADENLPAFWRWLEKQK